MQLDGINNRIRIMKNMLDSILGGINLQFTITMVVKIPSLYDFNTLLGRVGGGAGVRFYVTSSGNVVFSYKNGGSEEILKNIGYTFNINEKNKLIIKLNNLSTNEIKKKSKLSRLFANKNFDKKKNFNSI